MPKITAKGEKFYYFESAGSDYEVGLAKGKVMADDIAGAWEFFLPRMGKEFGTPSEKYEKTYRWLRKNLEQSASWMVEQMEGMAAGSGISIEKIFLINHYGLLWSAGGIDERILDEIACSSVSTITKDAGAVLAQNLEIGADDLYFVEKISSDGAAAILSGGMAGMCFSPCGINSQGLAVGSSNLSAISQKDNRDLNFGAHYHFLPRMVLHECGTTKDAIAYLKSLPATIPPAGGYQLNIIDRTGEMAVVDKTNEFSVVRKCFDDFNFTTNCSLDEELEAWRTGLTKGERDTTKSCYARSDMLKRWWEKQKEEVLLDDIKQLMRRHQMPGALCRHSPHEPNAYTRLSFLFFPNEGRMLITNGHPCCNEYQEFLL